MLGYLDPLVDFIVELINLKKKVVMNSNKFSCLLPHSNIHHMKNNKQSTKNTSYCDTWKIDGKTISNESLRRINH